MLYSVTMAAVFFYHTHGPSTFGSALLFTAFWFRSLSVTTHSLRTSLLAGYGDMATHRQNKDRPKVNFSDLKTVKKTWRTSSDAPMKINCFSLAAAELGLANTTAGGNGRGRLGPGKRDVHLSIYNNSEGGGGGERAN